jgi:hypothetical protein
MGFLRHPLYRVRGIGWAWSIVRLKPHLRVVVSAMHKSACCIFFVHVLMFAPSSFAQQAYSSNPYAVLPRPNSSAAEVRPPLRWRPLESASQSAESAAAGQVSKGASSAFDYTDEPFGLPRGTYRRIEQRHTITPHLEGYRFRPISPEEQLRNRQRNTSSVQTREADSSAQFFSHRNDQGGFRQGPQAPDFKFRPDPRLEHKGRDAPPRYTLPKGSGAPVFRPR